MHRLHALILALALVAPANAGVMYVEAAAGGAGTDFTADADCVAAWDFTSTGPTDLCDAGNSDDLTLNGTGSTHATVGGLGSWRSGSSGAYYRAADSTDFDDVEGDVDVTVACLLQEPTGSADWGDYSGLLDREDWVELSAFNRSSIEVVAFRDNSIEYAIPNSWDASHPLDTWHLYYFRRRAATDDVLPGWIDGAVGTIEEGTAGAVALATMPSVSTPIDVGRAWETDFGGISTPVDAIFSQCAIFSRLLTNDELCELAAYGVTGGDFDRSGTITCVP